ncbi:MAG: hypothetical protein J7L03_07160 [Caldisericaceae bacterium]|nr:hypothetical protein [Caldisericaceae bacterium]
MWQINDLIHYGTLLGFYISIGLSATFERKAKNYFKVNLMGKALFFLLLTMISYGGAFYLLYKLCHGFNFWFYFGGISIAAGLITHLFLPLERWSGVIK